MRRRSAQQSSDSQESTAPMNCQWSLPPERRHVKRDGALRRPASRSGKKARSAAESEQIESVGDRTDACLAGSNIVARSQIHRLDSTREAARLEQELDVRRPTTARHDRAIAHRL